MQGLLRGVEGHATGATKQTVVEPEPYQRQRLRARAAGVAGKKKMKKKENESQVPHGRYCVRTKVAIVRKKERKKERRVAFAQKVLSSDQGCNREAGKQGRFLQSKNLWRISEREKQKD